MKKVSEMDVSGIEKTKVLQSGESEFGNGFPCFYGGKMEVYKEE